jgi:hypothetical protein
MTFYLTVLHDTNMTFCFFDRNLSAVAAMFYSWLNNKRKPDATELLQWSEAITELMRDAMIEDEPPSVRVGSFELFMKVSIGYESGIMGEDRRNATACRE